MVAQSWIGSLHRRIANTLREERRRRHLSAQQLANKTAKLGYTITRDMINNYENGRTQSLDVGALLVLAHVLNVSALSLLFPDPPDSAVEVVPGVTVSTLAAVMEFTGDAAEHGPRIQLQEAVFQLERVIGSVMTGKGTLSAQQ